MVTLFPQSARVRDLRTGWGFDQATLARHAASRAIVLARHGVRVHSRVAICHRSPLGVLVDLFGAWTLGAVPVPLSPSLTALGRRQACEQVGPALFVGADAPAGVPSIAPALLDDDPLASSPAVLARAVAEDDAALILMTSGTTGLPKGVVLSRRALAARLRLNVERIGAPDMARTLAVLPLHFGHGLIGNVLTPLAAGADVALWPEPGLSGLARLGETIDSEGITFMSSVPSLWRVALKVSRPPERATLRRVHVGSEPLSPDLWRRIAAWADTAEVWNLYGITEAANWIAGVDGASIAFAEGAVGRPWGGVVRVIGAAGQLADEGRGEVVVQSPSVMTEYLDDPQATADVLRAGWFHTGDLGEIDTTGQLRLVGRLKYQINRGGIKISPEEIDRVLESHPDVMEASAFGMPDSVSGEVSDVREYEPVSAPWVSVVIPVFDGAATIDATVSRVAAHLARDSSSFEIVLINDGSRDATWPALVALSARHPQVVAVDLARNYSQHPATLCGIALARGSVIVTMDDDLQHTPEGLDALFASVREGHDVVFARYRRAHVGAWRRVASAMVTLTNRVLYGLPGAVSVSSFRAMTRDVAERMVAADIAWPYITGLAIAHARRPGDAEVRHAPEVRPSVSSLGARIKLYALAVFGHSVWPFRTLMVAGIVASTAGVWLLTRPLASPSARVAPSVLVGGLAMMVGAAVVTVGLVGLRWMARARRRPWRERYRVREVVRHPQAHVHPPHQHTATTAAAD
jgi:acyl-CoA synthetase (AMP-forming)/AMP-acid ligase II